MQRSTRKGGGKKKEPAAQHPTPRSGQSSVWGNPFFVAMGRPTINMIGDEAGGADAAARRRALIKHRGKLELNGNYFVLNLKRPTADTDNLDHQIRVHLGCNKLRNSMGLLLPIPPMLGRHLLGL